MNDSIYAAPSAAPSQSLLPPPASPALGQPPSVNILQRAVNGWTAFSKSEPGFGLGSYSMKTLAGVLMGAGAVACLGGGTGLPMVIAGAVIWGFATALSITALENKSIKSVTVHLLTSVICGGLGVGMGFMGLLTDFISDANLITVVRTAGVSLGVIGPLLLDERNLNDTLNLELYSEETHPGQSHDEEQGNPAANASLRAARIAREKALPRVDSLVLRELQTAYRKQGDRITLRKGDETIHLVIDNGEDCISLNKLIPSEEPELGLPADYNGLARTGHLPHVWVALRRSARGVKPAIYTLHQKSSVCRPDGQLLPGFNRHPTTRVRLSASASILENRDLLKWLDPEFSDEDHIPASSN